MNKEKIGEVNFGKFKTEFSLTPKVKEYLENEDVSLATLLPEGWLWYEVLLFDEIDANQDGEPDEEYGTGFEVIYYGIVEGRDLVEEDWDNENSKIKEEGFSEDLEGLDEGEKFMSSATTGLKSVKDTNKTFDVKYILRKI